MISLRTAAAVLIAFGAGHAIATSAQAQSVNDGPSGTGGAAGHSLELPDMTRGMGAPAPDLESQPSATPEPMNAPPVEDEKKDESAPPPADDGSQAK